MSDGPYDGKLEGNNVVFITVLDGLYVGSSVADSTSVGSDGILAVGVKLDVGSALRTRFRIDSPSSSRLDAYEAIVTTGARLGRPVFFLLTLQLALNFANLASSADINRQTSWGMNPYIEFRST
mmetsp:Transcript_16562/g.35851  ORF Transcript_16562/g.35851 Transcript_16562/m.35851 type:complete len:124 (+) Transcript_16562:459-830(+)